MQSKVYERINPVSRASLLTTSSVEANRAARRYGFTVNMGVPFKASPAAAPGLAKVLRLRSTRNHDLLFTTSRREASRAVHRHGYSIVGRAFYAATRKSACDVPVYRYQRAGVHRYTTSAIERGRLAKAGWRNEGTAFYGAPSATSGPTTAPTPRSSTAKPSPSPSPTSASSSASTRPTSSSAPAGSASAPSTTPPAPGGSGPLSRPLYRMTSGTQAWSAYQAATDPTVKRKLYQIAATPGSLWLGGASTDEARVRQVESAAVAQGKTPVFVLYAIPHRDCGSYSAGGLTTTAQYESWVNAVRRGINGRPAVVIVEPDAIGWGCLSATQRAARITMLKYAVRTMSQDPKTWAYVHAGSAGLSPSGVANSLKQIGIGYARGFAINVASFDTTASEIAYGKSINAALGMQKHFVIDTSRNGLGRYTGNDGVSNSCNPPGRAIGSRPTTRTANALVDAYLWIKVPGGSDGSCRPGDPRAGAWYQSYALGLVDRAIAARTIAYWSLPG